MQPNKTVENALAAVGAILWTGQAFPQIYKSYRMKSTKGISPQMMIIWASSSLFFMTYAVTRRLSIPGIIQVHFSFVVFSTSWIQCLYYSKDFPLKKALIYGSVWTAVCVAFEVGSIFGLWAAQSHGTEIPMSVYGYISSVLTVIGLIPQYYEIYRLKEVLGLSYSFIFTDIVGALFYIISLMFRPKLDISAIVIYVLTASMMVIIIILALILNPRAAKRRRLEGSTSITESTTPPAIKEREASHPTNPIVEEKVRYHSDGSDSESEPESGPSTPTGMDAHHEVPILEYSGLETGHEVLRKGYSVEVAKNV
ncbi:hypothetical protein I302_105101 [Kwoniella bestiolae CBS 10118]|uniref:Uncharacterized protein n=1 Tax=Kwoniella bestiolae CBS 10118 TaxID=1296100 RepID=A0A1B9FS69_9TREE|nr:hypothetical protein I302_08388 [Kwoniella bestiolae CBS 10118]OCF21613.1 hypothetical protein I302_08388 [Kwoniella bestiolae CBS 10118]